MFPAFPPRCLYRHRQPGCGRLAGYLLHRFYKGSGSEKVALFSGSLSYKGHEEREMGFRHILAEDCPQLQIVEQLEMLDDWTMPIAMELLTRHSDLAAIYNVGADNSGLAWALKAKDLRRRVLLIGHDATEDTRQLLLDGPLDAVIDQNPRVEAREALNALEGAITGSISRNTRHFCKSFSGKHFGSARWIRLYSE